MPPQARRRRGRSLQSPISTRASSACPRAASSAALSHSGISSPSSRAASISASSTQKSVRDANGGFDFVHRSSPLACLDLIGLPAPRVASDPRIAFSLASAADQRAMTLRSDLALSEFIPRSSLDVVLVLAKPIRMQPPRLLDLYLWTFEINRSCRDMRPIQRRNFPDFGEQLDYRLVDRFPPRLAFILFTSSYTSLKLATPPRFCCRAATTSLNHLSFCPRIGHRCLVFHRAQHIAILQDFGGRDSCSGSRERTEYSNINSFLAVRFCRAGVADFALNRDNRAGCVSSSVRRLLIGWLQRPLRTRSAETPAHRRQ